MARYSKVEPLTRCLCCGDKIYRSNEEESPFFCYICEINNCRHCQNNDGLKSELIQKYIESLEKPWKDPESLFCDTEFLKKFLGKEPAKGTECRDVHYEGKPDETESTIIKKQEFGD